MNMVKLDRISQQYAHLMSYLLFVIIKLPGSNSDTLQEALQLMNSSRETEDRNLMPLFDVR